MMRYLFFVVFMFFFITPLFSAEKAEHKGRIDFNYGASYPGGVDAGLSLNYITENQIHFKLSAHGHRALSSTEETKENDLELEQFVVVQLLSGYNFYASKHLSLSALAGLGFGEAQETGYKNGKLIHPEEKFINFPLELEFLFDLRFVGVGISLFANINHVAPKAGILLKFSLGVM